MSIIEWVGAGICIIFLSYICFRMFSKAIFRSYFEAKRDNECEQLKTKEEKHGI